MYMTLFQKFSLSRYVENAKTRPAPPAPHLETEITAMRVGDEARGSIRPLFPDPERASHGRRSPRSYWSTVITNWATKPALQDPISTLARLSWREETYVKWYHLTVNAPKEPMETGTKGANRVQVEGAQGQTVDGPSFGRPIQIDWHPEAAAMLGCPNREHE